jgi:hypothetical protein
MKWIIFLILFVCKLSAFDYSVQSGWNLFCPVISAPSQISSLFGDNLSKVTKIWSYTSAGWIYWASDGGSLSELEPNAGYWLLASDSFTLNTNSASSEVRFDFPGDGWYLGGNSTLNPLTLDTQGLFHSEYYLSGGAAHIQRIWEYKDSWISWPQGLETISSGRGYWFLLNSGIIFSGNRLDLTGALPPTCPGCPEVPR